MQTKQGAFRICKKYVIQGAIILKKLTEKQKKWLEFYNSGKTATESARLAGYDAKTPHGFESIGSANLKKLKEHIKKQEECTIDKAKALKELIDFWSEIISDTETDIRQRIKASELKAKATGVFTDRDSDTDSDKGSVVFFGEDDIFE